MPAPPSLVALPPRPTTILRAPRSMAAAIAWPTPNVDDRIGSRRIDEVQPAGLGALDVRRVADMQHGDRHVVAERAAHGDLDSSPPSASCSTSTNPGPPSAIGAEGERRRRCVALPALGDRPGRLGRGERARRTRPERPGPHGTSAVASSACSARRCSAARPEHARRQPVDRELELGQRREGRRDADVAVARVVAVRERRPGRGHRDARLAGKLRRPARRVRRPCRG